MASANPSQQQRDMSDDVACFFPETIAPPVALSKELEALHDFLAHQPVHASSERDLMELAQLSEKQLESKIRELENWNFRLNLDESKEIQAGIQMGVLFNQSATQRRTQH